MVIVEVVVAAAVVVAVVVASAVAVAVTAAVAVAVALAAECLLPAHYTTGHSLFVSSFAATCA